MQKERASYIFAGKQRKEPGTPADVQLPLPAAGSVNVAELSEAELNAELEKGYADMTEGRTRSAGQVFANIRKDYGV